MSVFNGQPANQTTFNNAFVSKSVDSEVSANIELNDSDLSQGPAIDQVQRELNSLNSFVGKSINTAKDVLPTWVNNGVGSVNDDLKDRAEALTADIVLREEIANKGVANGYCPLGPLGTVEESYLPQSVTGQLDFKGLWNAGTNSPTLSDATGELGWFYHVQTPGTQDLGSGSITFNRGDQLVHDGSVWQKIDGSAYVQKTEFRVISAGEEAAKQLTLAETPAFYNEVVLHTVGGSIQFYGDDYTVSGNVLTWNGLDLDGILSDGDRIVIQYVYV